MKGTKNMTWYWATEEYKIWNAFSYSQVKNEWFKDIPKMIFFGKKEILWSFCFLLFRNFYGIYIHYVVLFA